MPKEQDNYYFVKPVNSGWNSRQGPKVIRWNPCYSVQVDEEVDHYQDIDLYILKLQQRAVNKPETVIMKKYSLSPKKLSLIIILLL